MKKVLFLGSAGTQNKPHLLPPTTGKRLLKEIQGFGALSIP
jgi:hypothetical protein